MSPGPFDSRAEAPPAKRWEKGYGDENDVDTAHFHKLQFFCPCPCDQSREDMRIQSDFVAFLSETFLCNHSLRFLGRVTCMWLVQVTCELISFGYEKQVYNRQWIDSVCRVLLILEIWVSTTLYRFRKPYLFFFSRGVAICDRLF